MKVNNLGNASPLHSNNLVPFKKRREEYRLPGIGQDDGASALERMDPGLSAEEQSYVRRYLACADSFLENAQRGLRVSRNGNEWLPAGRQKNGKKAA